jgi:hypothetical protein
MYLTGLQHGDEQRSKMLQLMELVRHNPAVRSCIQRVYNEIVPTAVLIKESGKELTSELQRFLGPWFAQFLEHALEMAYMCGFVVFVRKRHEGIAVPVLLPLGSFTWGVEVVTQKTKKRKRELVCLYRYAVRPLHPEVTVEDLYVYNFVDPMLDSNWLPSPLDGLLTCGRVISNMQRRLESVVEFNSTKHILTSEKVDMVRDQTTEGISLLDSFRRYLHTGEHDGLSFFYRTRAGNGPQHHVNPSSEREAQIMGMLKNAETDVHVLPPNTEISELAALDLKTDMLQIQEVFERQVIQMFQMTAQPDINEKSRRPSASLADVKYMRHMSRFGTRLLQYAYACVYDIHEGHVEIQLVEPSSIDISGADDIKALSETNTLLPSDKLKLRKRLMQNV